MLDGNGDYAQFLGEGPLDVGENNSKSFTVEFWVMPTAYGAIISDDAYDIGYVYDANLGRDVIKYKYVQGKYHVPNFLWFVCSRLADR